MSTGCCGCEPPPAATGNPRYRKVLWIALVANAAMFGVEVIGGLRAGSMSLLADAMDFAGDAANYGISLYVLTMALLWRARAALLKGVTMGVFGAFVLAKTAWAASTGTPPEPFLMGGIAILALAVNLGVAGLLYRYREGDANMVSVWLCSRNDAIGNVAVVMAAVGVFGTGSAWPDLGVAAGMAVLALSASITVVRRARAEIAEATAPEPAASRN